MSMIKDWDTPFGPSSLFEKSKDMTRQEALEIQKAQDNLEWDSFRREAAKDILVGLCAHDGPIDIKDDVRIAIKLADELIKQLREAK